MKTRMLHPFQNFGGHDHKRPLLNSVGMSVPDVLQRENVKNFSFNQAC
jgi:hypothetical protein